MRVERFTFLCNADERFLIALLAERLQRTQGDAIRYLLRQKAVELGMPHSNPTSQSDSIDGLKMMEKPNI